MSIIRDVTYKEFLEMKNYAETTIMVYTGLKKHLTDDPTQDDVDRFLLSKPYKVARAFLKNYVKDYLHNKDIEIEQLRGRTKLLSQIGRVLSDVEYERLMKALPNREELMCRVMREAAMRQSACFKLTPKHLVIHENKIIWMGKGRRENVGLLKKSTMKRLVKRIEVHKVGDEDLIFNIKRSRLWQILTKVSEASIGKHVTSHWMKRTCGRWLEDLGLGLEERQHYLKHSDPKTTQKHYSFKKGRDVMDKVKIKLEME